MPRDPLVPVLSFPLFSPQAFTEYLLCDESSVGRPPEAGDGRSRAAHSQGAENLQEGLMIPFFPSASMPPGSNRTTTPSSVSPPLRHFGRVGVEEGEESAWKNTNKHKAIATRQVRYQALSTYIFQCPFLIRMRNPASFHKRALVNKGLLLLDSALTFVENSV